MSDSHSDPPSPTLLSGGRVVTPEGILTDGWIYVVGNAIVDVGAGRPPADAPALDLEGAWVLPGYIDLHVHGGGGHSVADSPAAMAGAVAFHRGHGTTATLVSLVTAPVDELTEQLGWAAELTRAGGTPRGCVLGSHLEGPFLSGRRCGAQNPAHMTAPDPSVLGALITAGAGTLRMMTIAPELDGAPAAIARLRAEGIVAALGHSDAGYAEAVAGIDAGGAHATHLFNGMAPLHHREPGLVGAALERGLSCELICDGRHLHPAIVSLVARLVEQPVLITDAIDAAGVGDGVFELGGQEVRVIGGEARLVRTDALAGSTLTMDDAVRRAVRDCGLSIEQAARAAATSPAQVIGLDHRLGAIATGRRADLVVLDDDLRLRRVMAAGGWCEVA